MTIEQRLLGLLAGDVFETGLAGCGEVEVGGNG